MLTTLDLIKQTAYTLDEPTSVVSATDINAINAKLDNYGWMDGALILYSSQANGSVLLDQSGKARLTESVLLTFALDTTRQDDDFEDKAGHLLALAVQFTQKLIRQEAFKAVPDNNTLQGINYNKEAYKYNGQFALVTLTFTLTFDPSIKTPKC